MNNNQFKVVAAELKQHCERKGMRVKEVLRQRHRVCIILTEQFNSDPDKPNIDYLVWDSSRPTLIVGYMRDTWNGKQSDMVRGGYLDFVCPIETRLL